MSKWLSVELSLLLLVSVVALAGLVSTNFGSDEESFDGDDLSGYATAPRGYSCAQYGGVCAQSSSSRSKTPTCPTGTYNLGSTYDCNVCCKRIITTIAPKSIVVSNYTSNIYTIVQNITRANLNITGGGLNITNANISLSLINKSGVVFTNLTLNLTNINISTGKINGSINLTCITV